MAEPTKVEPMDLRVYLVCTAPGEGLFRFPGTGFSGDSPELAIQRNDQQYLGPGQEWQSIPHWHRPDQAAWRDGMLELGVGAEIVDPIAAAASDALLISVRDTAGRGQGVLRKQGRLFGSGARVEPEPVAPPVQIRLDKGPGDAADPSATTADEPPPIAAEPPRPPAVSPGAAAPPPAQGPSRRPWALLLLVVAMAGVYGILAWRAGWPPFAPSAVAPEEGPAAVPIQAAPQTAAEGAGKDRTARVENPVGIALAIELIDRNRDAAAIWQEAERLARSGDCDAASYLYRKAAEADADKALALAQRFDPADFTARPCFEAPSVHSAQLWYQAPADAGDPLAQGRLGRLLIGHETAGPIHEYGRELLERAAAAGDEAAREALDGLGQGGTGKGP